MSLQVNDPRSRSRSKSPGRSSSTRERSQSRESRVVPASPSLSTSTTRPRSRSPVVEIAPKSKSASESKSGRSYDLDEEAEIERQYKLMKESRRREEDGERNVEDRTVASRVPRSPARYDVVRSDEEGDETRRRDEKRERETGSRREERYYHSESEDDLKSARSREYVSRSHQRKPPTGRETHADDSDDSVDDHLAYGDEPGSHPSYARPNRYQYAQPAQYLHSQPGPPRQPAYANDRDWAPIPECERPGFVPTSQAQPSTMPGGFPPTSAYADVPATTAPSFPAPLYAALPPNQPIPYAQGHGSSGPYAQSHYRAASAGDISHVPPAHYAQPAQYQYAQVDPHVRYTSKSTPVQPYAASPQQQFGRSQHSQPEQTIYPYRYSHEPQFAEKQVQPQAQQPQVVEITPGGGRSSARPHSLSVSSANSLGIAGGHGGRPASPLLEPYRGTYQSMSPMPSPMMGPTRDDEISDVEPLDGATSNSELGRRKKRGSDSEKDSRRKSSKDKTKDKAKEKDDKRRSRGSGHDRDDSNAGMVLISPTSGRKRVSFYDAAADAAEMQSALNHTRNIDNQAIIQILPRLTSDEILLLRQEYKTKVKMHGKGINLAKHLRLKLGNSSFGKVAYATALGRWESEAYWANCYYQAGTSRRELLIESLMGRSNAAIREIKNCFRDTRYSDSLEKCMRAELKADKFRTAVLLALDERRQDERESIDPRLVRQDVSDLHRALVSREGGETDMIHIVVLRSDPHLREVLRAYESVYGVNFARAMIAKSRNLVGETLAHILNGAINRPMRDALLLHQALRESRSGRERSELLISRLVRLHWEPRHLELVKSEYRRRYGERLEEGIAEEIMGSSGGREWGEFCVELARSSSSS